MHPAGRTVLLEDLRRPHGHIQEISLWLWSVPTIPAPIKPPSLSITHINLVLLSFVRTFIGIMYHPPPYPNILANPLILTLT